MLAGDTEWAPSERYETCEQCDAQSSAAHDLEERKSADLTAGEVCDGVLSTAKHDVDRIVAVRHPLDLKLQ